MRQSADILILGGGIVGCAIAETLAGEGLSVVVAERGLIGREASWAAAGMLAPQSEMPEPGPYMDFCLASRRLYPAAVARVRELAGLDPQYRDEGMLYAALAEEDERMLRARAAWQRPLGLRVEELSGDEARRIEPAISPAARMAMHFKEDHQLDPRLMTRAYAIAATRRGAELMEMTPANALIIENGRVVGAQLPQGSIRARWTILSSGSWSGLLAGLPLAVPTIPVKGQMLLLQLPKPLFSHTLHSPGIYLVPRLDGRVVVGSTEEPGKGFDKSVEAGAIYGLLSRAFELAPPLEGAELADTWSGLRPGTPDLRPIIGQGADGLILATGHYRNGVLLSPITAARVGEFVMTGKWNSDVAPFSPMRFAGK